MSITAKEPVSIKGEKPEKMVSAGKSWYYRHRQAVEGWIILVPILVYFFVFNIIPVLLNFLVSFTNWNGVSSNIKFVGIDNYLQYFKEPYPLIIFNTALFAFFILIIQTTVAFFVALLLNQKIFARGLYRALWYIPTLTSAAIVAQIGVIFIAPYGGVFNTILKSVGLNPVIWTTDPFWMRIFIIAFSVWRGLGGPVVLFLAALQGVHPELYEAARVDGATPRKLLWYITIPLIKPMILFVTVTSIIGGFQIFEAVYLISKGGPFNQTNVMLVQIYSDAFTNNNFGVAGAGAMVMMLILLWFSLISMRLLRQG
jgi:ABC-type sugar transport system permease subunit